MEMMNVKIFYSNSERKSQLFWHFFLKINVCEGERPLLTIQEKYEWAQGQKKAIVSSEG